jgi:hypothetical protein
VSFTSRAFTAFVLFSLLAAACQKQPEAVVETPAVRVENPELGLAIAALPQPFEETAANDGTWTFDAPGDAGAGTLKLTVGAPQTGSINLVELVKERRSWFESAAGGTYFGNRELGGPFGTIYTARGSYETPEGPVEETWAYAIHPGDYRLLSIQYTYPVGESGTRVEQLMGFLGEIEALGSDDGADAPATD